MAITKVQKEKIVSELKETLKKAGTLVFVAFRKLTVAQDIDLRRQLRGGASGYKVAKKTLLARALESGGYQGTLPELPGETAIAYGTGDDVTAPARVVERFRKKNQEVVEIVGGVFEGNYKDKGAMLEIAAIPDMQTLRGMFVNIINSPIQRFAIVLDAIAKTKN